MSKQGGERLLSPRVAPKIGMLMVQRGISENMECSSVPKSLAASFADLAARWMALAPSLACRAAFQRPKPGACNAAAG